MSHSSSRDDHPSLIDAFSKGFAASLGLVYVIGFVVVAAHLSHYGVSSFSVLQLQYLVAGFWVVAPIICGAATLMTARRFTERIARATGKWNWRQALLAEALATVPYIAFVALLVSIPNTLNSLTLGMGIRLFLFFIGILNSAQLFWLSWRCQRERETPWINHRHAAPFYLTAVLLLVFSYAAWFAARIYPLIPFSLGGGEPLTVVFISGDKPFPRCLANGSSAQQSAPYKLLMETDKDYVILSPQPGQESIEIARDSVQGLIVLQDPGKF